MRRKTKIFLGILSVLLMTIGGTIIWQWQNINAVVQSTRYTKEELADRISEQKENVRSVLADYGIDAAVDFTFEEEEAIRKGEMSVEEAMAQLEKRREKASLMQGSNPTNQPDGQTQGTEKEQGKTSANAQTQSGQNGQTGQSSQNGQSEAGRQVTQQAINQMYALKARYIGELGALERSAISEYKSLSAEQKKNGGIKSLVSKYMGPALALQGQCDAEVSGILNNLKSQLQAQGLSTEIVQTMRSSYEREKELKKAYYLSLVQ